MDCCLLSCDIDDYPMWRIVFEQINVEPIEWLIGRARQYFASLAVSPKARKISPVPLSECGESYEVNASEYWTDLAHGDFPHGAAVFVDAAVCAVELLTSNVRPSDILSTSNDWHQQSPAGSGNHHGAIVVGRWYVNESILSDEQLLAALALIPLFDLLDQHQTAVSGVISLYQAQNPDDLAGRNVDTATLEQLDAVHKLAQQFAVDRVSKAAELLEACDMCAVWRRNDKALASIKSMAKAKKGDSEAKHQEWLQQAIKIVSDRPSLRESKNKSRIAKLISSEHHETIRKLPDEFWEQVW